MECKEETGWDVDTLTNMIKVEPYWNVKSNTSLLAFIALIIKVEPYWNVKPVNMIFLPNPSEN